MKLISQGFPRCEMTIILCYSLQSRVDQGGETMGFATTVSLSSNETFLKIFFLTFSTYFLCYVLLLRSPVAQHRTFGLVLFFLAPYQKLLLA